MLSADWASCSTNLKCTVSCVDFALLFAGGGGAVQFRYPWSNLVVLGSARSVVPRGGVVRGYMVYGQLCGDCGGGRPRFSVERDCAEPQNSAHSRFAHSQSPPSPNLREPKPSREYQRTHRSHVKSRRRLAILGLVPNDRRVSPDAK